MRTRAYIILMYGYSYPFAYTRGFPVPFTAAAPVARGLTRCKNRAVKIYSFCSIYTFGLLFTLKKRRNLRFFCLLYCKEIK